MAICRFQYAAKVVCGELREQGLPLAPGSYVTEVNIYNPNQHDVRLRKELVLTVPPGNQLPGDVVAVGQHQLQPGRAVAVDCRHLGERLGARPFFIGFLVIESTESVDVTAVYTTASLREPTAPAVAVERVKERSLVAPETPAPRSWVSTGSLQTARDSHSATLLDDGTVLVAGGFVGTNFPDPDSTETAELFDPGTGTWSATGSMGNPRATHLAIRLPSNGKVLVVGGFDQNAPVTGVELYDPSTGTWSATGGMAGPRNNFTATLLGDGRVLAVGGYDLVARTDLSSAELYDPSTGTWTAAASMSGPRAAHAASLLIDGRVLVVGGANVQNPGGVNTAELYDPVNDSWTSTGSMNEIRETDDICCHAQIALLSGDVLAAGGFHTNPVPSAELYRPASGTWSSVPSMQTARQGGHTATLLNDATVLVVGGSDNSGPVKSSELYDPSTNSWVTTAAPVAARSGHTATKLSDGRVLAAGGRGGSPDFLILGTAETFG